MTSAPTIETERLRLRAWEDRDLDSYAALCADPEVMRYIANGEPQTRERAAEAMVAMDQRWDEHGFSLWCVAPLQSDECIGFVGLHIPDFLPEIMPTVEVGWRLARAEWGQGYTTEGARAARDFAFGAAGLDRLVSVAHAENTASHTVMQKLGMTLERATIHPILLVPVVVYELRRGA